MYWTNHVMDFKTKNCMPTQPKSDLYQKLDSSVTVFMNRVASLCSLLVSDGGQSSTSVWMGDLGLVHPRAKATVTCSPRLCAWTLPTRPGATNSSSRGGVLMAVAYKRRAGFRVERGRGHVWSPQEPKKGKAHGYSHKPPPPLTAGRGRWRL